jgi:hypothetical protein
MQIMMAMEKLTMTILLLRKSQLSNTDNEDYVRDKLFYKGLCFKSAGSGACGRLTVFSITLLLRFGSSVCDKV